MDKRKEIIDAARLLFTEYGYKKVSMDEIAKEANVTKKTIYHYFKDKDTLFQYFVTEELNQMKEKFELQTKKNCSFTKRMIDGIHDVLSFRKNSSLVKTIINEQKYSLKYGSNFLSQYDDEIINYLEVKFTDEMEKGTIKKCNPRLTAFIIYKVFFSVFFEYKEELNEEEIIKDVSSILRDGLIIEGGQNEK